MESVKQYFAAAKQKLNPFLCFLFEEDLEDSWRWCPCIQFQGVLHKKSACFQARNFTEQDTFLPYQSECRLVSEELCVHSTPWWNKLKKNPTNKTAESVELLSLQYQGLLRTLLKKVPKGNQSTKKAITIWFKTLTLTYFWIYKKTSISNCFQGGRSLVRKTKTYKNLQMNDNNKMRE